MKLHIALIALLVVAFSITLFAFDEDIPLERQGNEAAATDKLSQDGVQWYIRWAGW